MFETNDDDEYHVFNGMLPSKTNETRNLSASTQGNQEELSAIIVY